MPTHTTRPLPVTAEQFDGVTPLVVPPAFDPATGQGACYGTDANGGAYVAIPDRLPGQRVGAGSWIVYDDPTFDGPRIYADGAFQARFAAIPIAEAVQDALDEPTADNFMLAEPDLLDEVVDGTPTEAPPAPAKRPAKKAASKRARR